MRLLVCGGRDFGSARDCAMLREVLDTWHARRPVTLLIHGAARGADSLAAAWAASVGVERLAFPADWGKHGRAAGHMRNAQMLHEGSPAAVLAFPGGSGTADMVRKAILGCVPVAIARYNGDGFVVERQHGRMGS